MNSVQMLLTIAGMFLLSNLILNVNKANTERLLATYSSESVIDASGLAQSIIDEVQAKAFDEKTINAPVSMIDSLTLSKSLGADAGEINHTDFDDIDDYDNYSTTITLDRMGEFDVLVKVFYINNLQPDVKSNSPTFSKQVKVLLTNYSLIDTLKFNHIISY